MVTCAGQWKLSAVRWSSRAASPCPRTLCLRGNVDCKCSFKTNPTDKIGFKRILLLTDAAAFWYLPQRLLLRLQLLVNLVGILWMVGWLVTKMENLSLYNWFPWRVKLYLWRFNVHRLLLFSHRLTPPSLPRLRHTFFRPFFKPKKTFNSSKKSWLDLVSIKERRGGEVVSLDGSGLLLLLAVRVVRHLDRLLVVHVRRSENQDSTPHISLLLSLS